MQVHHRDRTALPYHRGRRLKQCFTWNGVGVPNHSGSLQTVQTGLLLAAARGDVY